MKVHVKKVVEYTLEVDVTGVEPVALDPVAVGSRVTVNADASARPN